MIRRAYISWSQIAAVLLVTGVLSEAGAEEKDRASDAQIFRPAMDPEGIFTVASGGVLQPLKWGFKAAMNLGDTPMRLAMNGSPDGGTTAVVDYSLGVNLQAYVGLFKFVQFGLDVSLYRQWLGPSFNLDNTDGFTANDPLSNIGRNTPDVVAGDVRLALKFGFLNKKGFKMAVLATGVVPWGDEAVFAGERSFAGDFRLAFSYSHPRFVAAVNAGYFLRKEQGILEPVAARDGTRVVLMELDDEVTWGAGIRVNIIRRLAVGVEAYGRVPVLAEGPSDMPMEVLGGLIVPVTNNMTLAMGGGTGLGRMLERDGLKPLGRAGTFRFFITATFATKPAVFKVVKKDTDGDGIYDDVDKCVNEMEDLDDFEDEDGCPEPDNDQDGIDDKDDKCPNESEDLDGWQDADGCPDRDNDGDGIPDLKDQCLNEPEDHDGYNDSDGCPDIDNDSDGIADAQDRCPDEAGPAANNGCPTAVGVGTGPREVIRGKIKLKMKIEFRRGRSAIQPKIKKELDRIAELLKRNPQVRLVRIESHTDAKGRAGRNLRLSQERANNVMYYIVGRGVPADRLQAVGYGGNFPVATNKTAKGRAANNRVEFIVVYD